MQKSLKYFLILFLIFITASSAFAGRYSAAFPVYMSEHQNDEMVTAIVTMADQVNLRELQDNLYAIHADRQLWHETVVRALQAKATETQADLMAFLSDQASLGNVEKYTGLWVGNVVIITAKPEVFDRIVAREDVDMVSPDYAISNTQPVSRGGDEPSIAGHEIGLERVAADQCWAMGITGDGRLVSSLDTGVQGDHPAFESRWAGLDPQYAGHPEWAWFDPVTNTDFPFDSGQHGTHTMGTICGRSETTGDTVGVAIDAHWISCGVIDRGGIGPTVTNALLSFQWSVDPDGNPSTVWDVPDVSSNSWGVTTGHGYPDCDETFWIVLDGCEAAGIVVVFAAGNEGPGATTLRRPADRATTDLTSFSVAAVDGNDVNLPIAGFSSRGPSYCTPTGDPTFKPEVSAPGVNVRSSVPGSGYQGGWSGTSMATPHIAGIVALMRQANPNLTSEQVRQILLDTATDLGDAGEDNDYGMGIANAYEAVLRALAYLEGWGTLAGVVTDQATGNPIQGAHLSVVGRPWGANSRGDGSFALFVPADTAWVIKIEHPPLHLPMWDTITVVENDTLVQNYALEGKVTATLTASFGNPVDASYRSFFIKGSWDADGFYNAGWSAPAIEIKDNGIAPDPTANDGIFTGTVLLARDVVHTYQWALYTENYGGENARLQNGANFTIPTLTPPTVPTLSVNPSGSDHNWNVSMYANGGAVTLDLTRGINGRPTKWGSAIALTGGVTYNVRFRIMHSSIASYGAGGVGGATIVYVPPIDGSYDFIFDDRDDSYVIQLTGTEGPPTYVGARSGLDGHIPVSWLPPGTVESQEISFDDGALVNAYYYYAYDNLMGTMFEPTSPTVVDSVIIHVLTDGDPYWPWPDGTNDPIGLSIYLDDGSGFPEADPAWYGEATGELGQWVRVDVPEVEAPGRFWVMMNNLDGGGDEGIGLDAATDYPANKWVREGGVWGQSDLYAGDHMIRAKVFGGTLDGWMGYDASPAGLLPANVPIIGNPALTTGSATANKQLSATDRADVNRMSYHPNVSRVNPPTITDTEVLAGYNLYRGTSTNPYNGGIANKINPSLLQVTNYDDWGTDAHGPIVNGTLYYYQASAVYDIGGGQFIEVGPSNEATGTAMNHPPANPINLTGSSLGNVVTLNWSPNTDYDIAAYRIFRRDYGAQNYNLVGTVNHPTTTYQETLPTDGIYRYKIAAVDNGTPGLQSVGFSNSVDIPIGAIPPRDLTASQDQDSQITLKWKAPGGSGGGDNIVLVIAADEGSMLISELQGYDDVTQIDYYDARNGVPTMGELEPYSDVIVWSNYPFADPFGMGDILADYVDNGGSVILAQFCFGSGWGLEGRIMAEYSPFSQGPTQYVFHNLGDYDPSDPIMEGVTTVSDLYIASLSVVNEGTLVASWDDGTPFVGYNPDVPVICINAYVGDQRQFTGDMITIVHNALNAGGGAEVTPASYNLYKAAASGGPFNLLVNVPGTQKTYIDTPVPNAVDYWYRVTAVYPGPDESDPSNIAQGRAVAGATMLVNPASINRSILPGIIDTSLINIINDGGLPLDYTIVTTVDQRLSGFTEIHPSGNSVAADFHNNIVDYDKGNLPAEPHNPPVLLGRGGPDEYGYVWVDSDEPGGPVYSWVDITGIGEMIPMSSDDQNLGPYSLGFDFPFYGNMFNTVNICSNGWISFTSMNGNYFNQPLPDPTMPENMVAPFWDDLYPPLGGQYWFYSDASQAVISFIDVMHIGSGGPYTFQIVMTASGNIFYNYAVINYPDDSYTCGIQNGDGTIGLTIAFDAVYLHNDMTIKISTGWLSTDPRAGVAPAGGQAPINVIFDASQLAEGNYTGSLFISGHDIHHQVGETTIPVTLHVSTVSGCQYTVGDVNGSHVFNGIDVTYGVAYFKGGNTPPYTCDCNGSTWYVAGDVNGNCSFNGIDITYMVSYFKGGPLPIPCPACPPSLYAAPGNPEIPAVQPVRKLNTRISGSATQE